MNNSADKTRWQTFAREEMLRASGERATVPSHSHRLGIVMLFAIAAAAPAFAHGDRPPPPTPICTDLASDPTWGLAGNPSIADLTAVIAPASGSNVAYCQVDLTDVSLAGEAYGYMPGQTSKIRVRVGLPLNENDGGTGGVAGAWNGKIQSRGNGGFAGAVSGVTPATNSGYVGTGSDTGHNSAIRNPIPNPNAPPATVEAPPSENGAVFALNPDGTVNEGRIMDYGWRGQHHANMWGQIIAEAYYGQRHMRNYFVGCS